MRAAGEGNCTEAAAEEGNCTGEDTAAAARDIHSEEVVVVVQGIRSLFAKWFHQCATMYIVHWINP
jgi:hypothetical protein